MSRIRSPASSHLHLLGNPSSEWHFPSIRLFRCCNECAKPVIVLATVLLAGQLRVLHRRVATLDSLLSPATSLVGHDYRSSGRSCLMVSFLWTCPRQRWLAVRQHGASIRSCRGSYQYYVEFDEDDDEHHHHQHHAFSSGEIQCIYIYIYIYIYISYIIYIYICVCTYRDRHTHTRTHGHMAIAPYCPLGSAEPQIVQHSLCT